MFCFVDLLTHPLGFLPIQAAIPAHLLPIISQWREKGGGKTCFSLFGWIVFSFILCDIFIYVLPSALVQSMLIEVLSTSDEALNAIQAASLNTTSLDSVEDSAYLEASREVTKPEVPEPDYRALGHAGGYDMHLTWPCKLLCHSMQLHRLYVIVACRHVMRYGSTYSAACTRLKLVCVCVCLRECQRCRIPRHR